ncbi:MAG: hypothetical protein NC084_04490 [Bacteroides sp.]|nr:hypothetical protein [Eubacterium sp.]MCM1419770.1 hypothetical protein [Roseburia sp.]MCM1461957.1 hypothetical protein [Bacteroides sp.]
MCKIMEDIRNEGKKEVALKLIALGKLSLEEIAKCTLLSLSEVKELAKKKSA